MSFFSTRGTCCVTASQAILNAFAPDGGLYVPAIMPSISQDALTGHIHQPYYQVVASILDLFLEDFSYQELLTLCEKAYGADAAQEKAPLRFIDDNTFFLELFHGPTLSFKDFSMALLPHLIALAANKNGLRQHITALVATTGNTGAAALNGFKQVDGLSLKAFYPEEKSSILQQAYMQSLASDNAHALCVQGPLEDVRKDFASLVLSSDTAFDQNGEKSFITSGNSINFGRLASQIAYYFVAYASLLSKGKILWGDPVHFVIPTGNFGNVLAGFYARNMGLPIGKLICASNRNNALSTFFKSGTYSTHRLFFNTLSPSMDITFPRNLERLLYDITDRDGALVKEWMDLLDHSGSFSIGEQRMEWLSNIFASDFCDDVHTKKEIKLMFDRYGLLLDPHSAVASHVLQKYRNQTGDGTPAVILATASPYKFPQEVLSALQDAPPLEDSFKALAVLSEYTHTPIPPQLEESWLSPFLMVVRKARTIKEGFHSC